MSNDFLELKVQEYKKNKIFFQIKNQTFRTTDFFDGKTFFLASNNIKLISAYLPQCVEDVVYVLGQNSNYDNDVLKCDLTHYMKILQAVKEYNEQR